MDNFPTIQKPSEGPIQPQITRTVVPPVLPVPLTRRKIKQRHPFDIYEDQLEELRKLSVEDRMAGGVGSMSAMVRAALDAFIAKKRGR